MRRNSKQSEDFNAEIRTRLKGSNGGAEGDSQLNDDDDEAEQSQKKQRIVSFDQSSSDNRVVDCESFMDTTTIVTEGEGIIVDCTVLQENESEVVLLNRPPRL